MNPVSVGALAELIATAITAAAGKSWKVIRSSPEAKQVEAAVQRALIDAFRHACRRSDAVDDDWLTQVAGIWTGAFTVEVREALLRCLASADGGQTQFSVVATQALRESGCDVAELERVFWVDQFLSSFPSLLFAALKKSALSSGSHTRELIGHLLDQREDSRASAADVEEATPRQFREDVINLLQRLDAQACKEGLPAYLPHDADVRVLAHTVRVTEGVRTQLRPDRLGESTAYQLPVERAADRKSPRSWPLVEAENRRLIVLGDPGLGKSWLIRTETHRLCRLALASIQHSADVSAVLIPIPLRCDQLVASGGQQLARAAATYMVDQGLLPSRSRGSFEAQIDAGGIVLLLDAMDELTADEQYGRLKRLLRAWQATLGEAARCVLTSRIAGYRGSPLPSACEVELQASTFQEVTAAVTAWHMPMSVSAKVLARVQDPAVAGMARVPLLLALLCSLAAEEPDGALPSTKGELYERVLRWFLTRGHRANDQPDRPELLAEEVDSLLDILGPLAFHFATQPSGWTDLMPADQLRSLIRLAGPAFTERNQAAADLVRELSIETGILLPAGDPSAGRHPGYLFPHRTFAEYLVARHLTSLPVEKWQEVISGHLWFDPDWAEVIPLFGAQLEPGFARRLVEYLLAQADDPFHHALLTAVRVLGERSDLEELFPVGDLTALAGKVLGLIDNPHTRGATADTLTAVPRLPKPMTDGLLDRLDSADWQVLWTVAHVLSGREASNVTARLLPRLDDPDRQISTTVADALAALGTSEAAYGLLPYLGAADWSVGKAAARAMARLNTPAAAHELLAQFDADPRTRAILVEPLAKSKSSVVVAGLLARLDYQDPDVRSAAASALAEHGAPAVARKLADRLDDLEPYVRMRVAQALTGRDEAEVTERLLTHADDPFSYVRGTVVGALGGREGARVTDVLLSRLRDPDWYVRSEAVGALADRNTPPVTAALVKCLDDPSYMVAGAVIWALAWRDAQEVTDALLRLAGDPDRTIWKAAMDALAGREAPPVTVGLLAYLGNPEPRIRAGAASALAGRRTPEVRAALLGLLNDGNSNVQEAAVRALAGEDSGHVVIMAGPRRKIRPELDPMSRHRDRSERERRPASESVASLLACLDRSDPAVRSAVAQALAGEKAPMVTHALLVHLDDREPQVRLSVISALSGRIAPEVSAGLLRRLDDSELAVRVSAANALAEEGTYGDFLTFAHWVRSCDARHLGNAYRIAERTIVRNYRHLPAEAQDLVRADLAWLTRSVLVSPRA